jgi:hypothetical protein
MLVAAPTLYVTGGGCSRVKRDAAIADVQSRESTIMLDAIVGIAMGIWVTLVGLGKTRVSKNPAANAAFVKSWGLVFKIAGPVMIGVAVVRLVSRP